uniref:Uncharacterized protein n=1 Tax=Arundo donax TaxID=35708 RepID=A0A0A9H1W4_ARUDO
MGSARQQFASLLDRYHVKIQQHYIQHEVFIDLATSKYILPRLALVLHLQH